MSTTKQSSRTALQPSHIGEYLVARVLNRLHTRPSANGLDVKCRCDDIGLNCPGITIQETLHTLNGGPWHFASNANLQPLSSVGGIVRFDGEHRVDCAAFGDGVGLPMEVKLGTKRLNASRVNRELLRSCYVRTDRNGYRWIKGNMMAVLDRQWPAELSPQPLMMIVDDGPSPIQLSSSWWLIVRERVLSNWKRNRPSFSANVHIACFETLVERIGEGEFNLLVSELLNDNYFGAWLNGTVPRLARKA